MLDLIDKAVRFASIAHDKTYRKGDSVLPYFYHPVMLAFYLLKYNCSDEVIAAALLHDVVEDTDTSLDQIRLKFGDQIHDWVSACTENKDQTWEERKQHQIDAIKTLPIEVLMIKCADKLNNVLSTINDYKIKGDEVWNDFNRGKEKKIWYNRSLISSFESRKEINTHPLFTELKKQVNILFPQG